MRRIDARTTLAAWRACRESGINVFAPGVAARLGSLPGWTSFGIPDGEEARGALLEAIRSLELLARETRYLQGVTEIVATHPAPARRLASTRDVARTLVQGARRELLVLGYSITDSDFRDHLIRRGMERVNITVVSDRGQTGSAELLRQWPARASPLVALEGVEPERGNDWKVHGKVIVADRNEALVGSANFTASGLRRNLEIGVRLTGRRATDICELVESLHRDGWLVRARP